MSVFRIIRHAAAALGGAALLAVFVAPAPVRSSPAAGWAWSVVASPDVTAVDNQLVAVATVSATDAWAAGAAGMQTLIERWDGSAWSIVASPNVGTGDNKLFGVAVVAPDDVWAVGIGSRRTLVLHWNGSMWSVVTSPNMGDGSNSLRSIYTASPDDAWAVGRAEHGILVERWRGTSWRVVDAPVAHDPSRLDGVSGSNQWGVWMVGRETLGRHGPDPIALQWTGSQWQYTKVRRPPSPSGQMWSNFPLAAVSATAQLRIVGSYQPESGSTGVYTLEELWGGHSWKLESTPDSTAFATILYGLSVLNWDDAWAVGIADSETFVMHLDSTLTWTRVDSPSPVFENGSSTLLGVSTESYDAAWAVGYYEDSSGQHTLIERGVSS